MMRAKKQMLGKVVCRTPTIRACIHASIAHSDSRLSKLCTCDEAVPRQDTKVTTHRKCKLLLVRRRGLRCGSYVLACSMQRVCMNLAMAQTRNNTKCCLTPVQTAPIGYTSIDRLAVGLAYAVSAPRDNASGRFVCCGFARSARSMRARKQTMRHAYPCAGTISFNEALYKPECFIETQWHCRPQEIDQ